MNVKKLTIIALGALLFVWGCGDDDPAAPDDGNGGKTSTPWTTVGGDFEPVASATAQVADVGTYRWRDADMRPRWTTPGGDYEAAPSASADVADVGAYRWGSSAGMVADVQDWVDNPGNDFGWLIRGDETTASAKRFDTKENATAANGPKLTVYHDGSATPVVLGAAKDNTLYEDAQGDRSNGAGEYMFAGKTQEVSESLRRALVAFAVADSLAPGSVIDSVFLDLNMSRTTGHPQAFTTTLHKVLADWGEGASAAGRGEGAGADAEPGDATWLFRFNTQISISPSLKADVQSWVDATASNFGWLLQGDETTVSAKRFDSRTNPTAANHPKLIVYHDGSTTPTTIPAVKDNTLYEDPEGDKSNGAGDFLFAGLTAEPSDAIRRGLIAFSVADSITAPATIDSVFLELNMSKTTGHVQAFAVSLHKVWADWGEGTSDADRGEGAGAPATSGDATWKFSFYEP